MMISHVHYLASGEVLARIGAACVDVNLAIITGILGVHARARVRAGIVAACASVLAGKYVYVHVCGFLLISKLECWEVPTILQQWKVQLKL